MVCDWGALCRERLFDGREAPQPPDARQPFGLRTFVSDVRSWEEMLA